MATGALVVVLCACGGPAQTASQRPEHPAPIPAADAPRRAAIAQVGLRLYDALEQGDPARVLFDDVALRSLLVPQSATRVAARRPALGARLGHRSGSFALFREAAYRGVCLQGSRLEPADSALGLRRRGWVFDRALVFGEKPGGRRVAAWVEGTFVYTNAGFGALDLERVETPRWQHSDLQLAHCDMEVGLHSPLPVVGVTE